MPARLWQAKLLRALKCGELPTSEIAVAKVPVAPRPAFQEAPGEHMVLWMIR